jgi:hypothetical protein
MKRMSLLAVLLTTALAACGEAAVSPSSDVDEANAAPAAPARLDESGLPRLKAGLWEITERRDGEVEVRRVCRAAGVDKEVRDVLFGPAEPGCTKTGAAVANGRSAVVQCERNDAIVQIKLRISGGETRFTADVQTTVTPTTGQPVGETLNAVSRWISDCPAGMAPGDEAPSA